MMKTRQKVVACFAMLMLLLSLLFSFFYGASAAEGEEPTKPDIASFVGYSGGMSETELHEKTLIRGEVGDLPSMTVLVPGQGGTAANWAYGHGKNDDGDIDNAVLSYDEDSMVEVLRNQAGDADVYLAEASSGYEAHGTNKEAGETEICSVIGVVPKYEGLCGYCRDSIGFKLRKLDIPRQRDQIEIVNDRKIPRYVGDYIKSPGIVQLEQVSKHIIVFFQGSPGAVSNFHWVLNDELNHVLDKLSYDYMVLTGRLPVLNMVSHSRGGLTSMLHASGYNPRIKFGEASGVDNTIINLTEAERTSISDGTSKFSAYDLGDNTFIQHKYNVKDLFSLGTPYKGTRLDIPEARMALSHAFDHNSADDILDPVMIEKVNKNWDSAVEENSQLSLYTAGESMDISFIIGMILEDLELIKKELPEKYNEANLLAIYKDLIKQSMPMIRMLKSVIDGIKAVAALGLGSSSMLYVETGGSVIAMGMIALSGAIFTAATALDLIYADMCIRLHKTLQANTLEELAYEVAKFGLDYMPFINVFNDVFYDGYEGTDIYSASGDLFVDIDSQRAGGFANVKDSYIKKLQYYELEVDVKSQKASYHSRNFDSGKKSMESVGIPHNLETRDDDLIAYVAKRITFGKPRTIYRTDRNNDSTLSVEGVSYQKYKDRNGAMQTMYPETLDLSQLIGGYPVAGIGDGVFENNPNLKKIILPDRLTNFGYQVFSGCMNLSQIAASELKTKSNIDTIPQGVYSIEDDVIYLGNYTQLAAAAPNLKSLEIKDSVTEILPFAFFGSQIEQFSGGASVNKIGKYAFLGTPWFYAGNGLIRFNQWIVGYMGEDSEDIEISATDSENICIADNVFSPYVDSHISYLPSVKNIKLSAGVSILGRSAFENNMDLVSVDLSQSEITEISDYTFSGCENLGNVALNSSIEIISSGAFMKNIQLKKFALQESIQVLGSDAFYGCANLNEVIAKNLYPISIGPGAFSLCGENLKIYVPHDTIDLFRATVNWRDYGDKIMTSTFKVILNADGGLCPAAISVSYFGYLRNLPIPQKAGYDFIGWYDSSQVQYSKADYWKQFSDGILTARYEEKIYSILFSDGILTARYEEKIYSILYYSDDRIYRESSTINADRKLPSSYSISQRVSLKNITKQYNTFLGWYDNSDFNGDPISAIPNGSIGTKVFYAKWQPDQTMIVDENGQNIVLGASSVGYNQSFELITPTKDSYVFEGWYSENGSRYTNSNGLSVKVWDIPKNRMTLVAKWRKESYVIKIDNNGDIYFVDNAGVHDELTSVLYGNGIETAAQLKDYFIASGQSQKDGYIFAGLVDSNGEPISWGADTPDFGNDSDAFVISPKWEKERHEINFLDCGRFTFEFGEQIRYPFPTKNGYRLVCWKVVGSDELFSNNERMPDLTGEIEADGSVSLYPVWEACDYRISFMFGGVQQAENAAKFDSIGLTSIVLSRAGYTFNGWNDIAGTQYFNHAGRMTKKWDKAYDTALYADWTVIQYSITYVLNEGVNSPNAIYTYTVNDDITFLAASKYMYKFAGWYADQDLKFAMPSIATGRTGNVTLYAKWNGVVRRCKGTYFSISATRDVEILDMRDLYSYSSYFLQIGSGVNEVSLVGEKTELRMRIAVDERTNPLTIRFNDVSLTASNWYNAIDSYSKFNLIIDINADTRIEGGSGGSDTSLGGFGGNGASAIYAPNCSVYVSSTNNYTLTLKGGNGGNSGSGMDGKDGLKGGNGRNISQTKTNAESGKAGGDGANGARGRAGGDGGHAVIANGWNVTGVEIEAQGGKGGKGGNGGNGGNGGKGGDGGSDDTAMYMGEPGAGGKGGNGGYGGRGGARGIGGCPLVIGYTFYGKQASNGDWGTKGSGGKGGTGGGGGSAGAYGANAAGGASGSDGE